mmetsp:Transcript_37710/g.95755  ORF Transcript_37710/g.95755 Transcript_37710/m.95755 type:complete len:208 (-) Transcript_37710:185-808(-)
MFPRVKHTDDYNRGYGTQRPLLDKHVHGAPERGAPAAATSHGMRGQPRSDDAGADERGCGLHLAVRRRGVGGAPHPGARHRAVGHAPAMVAPVEVELAVGRAPRRRRRRSYSLGRRADRLPRPDDAALGHARPDVSEPAAGRAVGLDRRGARLAGACSWRGAARARGRDRGLAQLGVTLRRLVGRAPLLRVAFVARHVRDHVARRQA